MNIRAIITGVVTVLSLCAAGCAADSAGVQESEEVLETSQAQLPTLAGKYKFVFDDARRSAIYAELGKRFSGAELAAAKREADEEAEVSVLEFRDGRFISWVGEKAIFEASYQTRPDGENRLLITMEGKSTHITFADSDTIVVEDPRKGELTFERMR